MTEHIFKTKVSHLKKIIPLKVKGPLCEGLRYIDDLIAFFPYNKTDRASYALALFIKEFLSNYTYHPDMLLKDEPMDNNSFNFLETTITYKGFTKFDVKHLDKNVDSLLHHNKLKKIKTIHASSFAPKPQATNIVLNTLHRINNNCSSDSLKTLATLEHIYVATHFGYKKKHFRNALKKMHATTDNSLWDTLTAILNDDFWHTYSASTRLLTHSILSTPHGHHTNP